LLRSTALNPSAVGNPNFDYVFVAGNTATSDYERASAEVPAAMDEGLAHDADSFHGVDQRRQL
jgi:hypothetical protein